ncbi:hypothetical protein HY630_00330 [Candidatus Uhrbacteria bacterium]|nr:hypothetical protein [Candidatus Uhrbacteria bacterium]
MTKPSAVLVLKTTVLLGAREKVRLPLWWYTTGARETLGRLWRSIPGSVRYLGVDIWARNLFVPMYGETSFLGRVISFFVRLVVVMFRSLGVVAWTVVAVGLATVYLAILPFAIFGILSQVVGVLL